MKLILKGLSLLRQGRFIEFQEKALLKLQHGIAGFKCRFLDVSSARDSLVTTTIKSVLEPSLSTESEQHGASSSRTVAGHTTTPNIGRESSGFRLDKCCPK